MTSQPFLHINNNIWHLHSSDADNCSTNLSYIVVIIYTVGSVGLQLTITCGIEKVQQKKTYYCIPLLTPENPHLHSCHHPNGYEYYEQHQIQVLIFLCYQLNQKDLRNRLKSTESKLVQFNKYIYIYIYMQSLQSLCALMYTFASSTLVTHSK